MADIITGRPFLNEPQEKTDSSRKVQRVLIILIVALSIVLIGELVYHLVIAPRLTITSINVINDTGIQDEELLAQAGISSGLMYFEADAAQFESRLESLPVVRDASVQRIFPNALNVRVLSREPLAWSIAQTPGGFAAVVFDSEGVVFRLADEPGDLTMPVISGLSFPAADPGLVLPDQLLGFLESLYQFRADAPELYGLISEYRIVPKDENSFEIVFYPMHFDVPVRIGGRIERAMIEYVFMVIEALRQDGRLGSIAEIDFRSGEGVLRPKGDDRG